MEYPILEVIFLKGRNEELCAKTAKGELENLGTGRCLFGGKR